MKSLTIVTLIAILLLFWRISFAQEIHQAAKSGDITKIKALIDENPEIVNDRDLNQNTPLHLASQYGHPEVVALLLDHQADVNTQNKDLFTPLHLAGWYQRTNLIELLVKNGANIEAKEYRGATPLMMFIWRNSELDLVKFLVDQGADINAHIEGSWVTPVALAAQYGYTDIVNYLLDKGAAVDEKNRVLVRLSVKHGLDRLFAKLHEQGADLRAVGTNNGGTIFHFAAEGGSVQIIQTLMEAGFNIDSADRYGWIPLHYAAYAGKDDAIGFLLNNDVNINSRTLSGKSAYNMADEKGHAGARKLLARKGADISPQHFPLLEEPYLGQTPPGEIPEVFALDIVSTPLTEHGNVTFTPDGKMMLWTSEWLISSSKGSFKIYSSEVGNGSWTPPRFAFFTGELDVNDDVPFITPGGERLFFMSKRPSGNNPEENRENYWMMQKTDTGWSEPAPIGEAVNRMTIRWQISGTENGTIYFGSSDAGGQGGSDLYRCEFVDGAYETPENLGMPVNSKYDESAPFIAPDESYLIFNHTARRDRSVKDGLYITYNKGDGNWSEPVYMGDTINYYGAICPSVSPDGKYLFFNSGRNGNYDFYWVDATIIEKLKQ